MILTDFLPPNMYDTAIECPTALAAPATPIPSFINHDLTVIKP